MKKIKIRWNGSHYTALCPFHDEKTPSFVIDFSREVYCCFSCGKNGKISDLIEHIRKADDNARANSKEI